MELYSLVALLPIVAVMFFLVILHAVKAMPVAYGITLLIALTLWQVPTVRILAAMLRGTFIAATLLWIIFSAIVLLIVLLFTLRESGVLAAIRRGFMDISQDRRIQAIVEYATGVHKTEKPTESTPWLRYSAAQETREYLSAALKGWWKLRHPIRALRLYQACRTASEANRQAANQRLLERRRTDPALASLNDEQRRAVLIQEDCTLIVAGAGTGKTHMMVEKARDTVRTGLARPSQIAFVTFTRKAAGEIRSRSTGLEGMEIGTLHHLAWRVIEMAEGRGPRLSPLAEDDDRARIKQIEVWLLEAIGENPSLLLDLQTRYQAFEMYRAPDGDIPPEPRVPPDGIRVRSMGEAQIATILHLANISYKYEAEFQVPEKHRTRKGARYRPDFYLPDDPAAPPSREGGIWLEHFANDTEGELPQQWDEEGKGATAKYRADRRWKEELHASLGTRFVWTEVGDIQRCIQAGTSFPDLLLRRIATQGRSGIKKPSTWEIRREIERLRTTESDAEHWRIAYEINKWIRTRRQQVWGKDQALNAAIRAGETPEEEALHRLAAPVLDRYERHLEKSGTVDYEGTILEGWRHIREESVEPPWTMILVDEYQDVNPAQAAFVRALLKPRQPGCPSTGARLTAVGDDWQAIFGFQGGDVSLIREFRDPAGEQERYVERGTLKQTYRFGQPLADTTRAFVDFDNVKGTQLTGL